MDQPALAAHIREQSGKGAARKLRKNNQIPAVFYGPKADTIMLTVDSLELKRIVGRGGGENTLLDLELPSNKGPKIHKALLKDLSVDPVKGTFLHADFYAISMDRKITVDVPIRLVNTPIGVANGGILQHVRRQLTISCLPDKMIDALDLDVSALDIGDALHVNDLELPEGVTSEDEGSSTVAIVAAPTIVEEVVEEEAEVIEEGAPETEAEEATAEETQE